MSRYILQCISECNGNVTIPLVTLSSCCALVIESVSCRQTKKHNEISLEFVYLFALHSNAQQEWTMAFAIEQCITYYQHIQNKLICNPYVLAIRRNTRMWVARCAHVYVLFVESCKFLAIMSWICMYLIYLTEKICSQFLFKCWSKIDKIFNRNISKCEKHPQPNESIWVKKFPSVEFIYRCAMKVIEVYNKSHRRSIYLDTPFMGTHFK